MWLSLVALTSRFYNSSSDHLPFRFVSFLHLACALVCVLTVATMCASLTTYSSGLSHGITMGPPTLGVFAPVRSCDQVLSEYTQTEKTHFNAKCRERETTFLFLDSSLDPFSSLLCTFVIQHQQCMTFDPVSFLRRLFWSLERFPHTHFSASCGRPGPLGATGKNSFGT